MKKPKIITLCGSSKFCDIMAVCAWLLERDEGAIALDLHLLPIWYPNIKDIPDHLAEHEGCTEAMDELHLRKIDLSDEIFVVDRNEYIGESTAREIEYAKSKGMADTIRYYSQDNIGYTCEAIIKEFLNRKKEEENANTNL